MISEGRVQDSVQNVVNHLKEHPDQTRFTDTAATAIIESGLRFRVEGSGGVVIVTNMPKEAGGRWNRSVNGLANAGSSRGL
jgi:hypothetical protein